MIDFEAVFRANEEKIMTVANANTHINEDGLATISRDDDWFDDDVWEQDIERWKNAVSAKRSTNQKHHKSAAGMVG